MGAASSFKQIPTAASKGSGKPQQAIQQPANKNIPQPMMGKMPQNPPGQQMPAPGGKGNKPQMPAPGGKGAAPPQMPAPGGKSPQMSSAMGEMAAKLKASNQMPQQPGLNTASPDFYKQLQGIQPQMPAPGGKGAMPTPMPAPGGKGGMPPQMPQPGFLPQMPQPYQEQKIDLYKQILSGQNPQPGLQPQMPQPQQNQPMQNQSQQDLQLQLMKQQLQGMQPGQQMPGQQIPFVPGQTRFLGDMQNVPAQYQTYEEALRAGNAQQKQMPSQSPTQSETQMLQQILARQAQIPRSAFESYSVPAAPQAPNMGGLASLGPIDPRMLA